MTNVGNQLDCSRVIASLRRSLTQPRNSTCMDVFLSSKKSHSRDWPEHSCLVIFPSGAACQPPAWLCRAMCLNRLTRQDTADTVKDSASGDILVGSKFHSPLPCGSLAPRPLLVHSILSINSGAALADTMDGSWPPIATRGQPSFPSLPRRLRGLGLDPTASSAA